MSSRAKKPTKRGRRRRGDGEGARRGNLDDADIGRTDDPVRMYLREMGSVELLVARRRDRDRQAHRGRPRDDDRRHLRKPADHARADRLARRAERKPDAVARHRRSRRDLRQQRIRDRGSGASRPRPPMASAGSRRSGGRGRSGDAAPRAPMAKRAMPRKTRSRSPRWKRELKPGVRRDPRRDRRTL